MNPTSSLKRASHITYQGLLIAYLCVDISRNNDNESEGMADIIPCKAPTSQRIFRADDNLNTGVNNRAFGITHLALGTPTQSQIYWETYGMTFAVWMLSFGGEFSSVCCSLPESRSSSSWGTAPIRRNASGTHMAVRRTYGKPHWCADVSPFRHTDGSLFTGKS